MVRVALIRPRASSDVPDVISSGFDYFSWRGEAAVLAVMGGGMSYHLIHDGGAWLWFVFPAIAAARIGWLVLKRPPARKQRFSRRAR
jgi:hypothetical protein